MTGMENTHIMKGRDEIMDRYLEKNILEDLKEKMVFVGGPRQVGKTTLALKIAPRHRSYLNWDILEDREFIFKQKFPVENFIIYDEIHKFHEWRNYIKGLYDKFKKKKRILVTGSGRLDYYRQSGDSLQGRYHFYRLHPFTVKELSLDKQKDMEDLLTLGGFPEPFLSGSQRKANRWMREYRSRIINEDIASLESSQKISRMELLSMSLPEFVGSPLSINSLRHKLGVAHKTVEKWLDIFERMYLIYRISSFTSKKLRSVKKERKHYHYNWAEIPDRGFRFENLMAGHLLKWVHFRQDYHGEDMDLFYFRDTDKREVDFIVTQNGKPVQAIECKLKERPVSPHLEYFKKRFPRTRCIQVHLEGFREYISSSGIEVQNWKTLLGKTI